MASVKGEFDYFSATVSLGVKLICQIREHFGITHSVQKSNRDRGFEIGGFLVFSVKMCFVWVSFLDPISRLALI